MQFPEWTKPALTGVAAGAIAISIIGFNWGGWVTGGAAAKMSSDNSAAAVVLALTPYCIRNSENDPGAAAILVELEDASSYQRHTVVSDAGWATPLGADEPSRALADACEDVLSADT
jgi:hypothetical protein